MLISRTAARRAGLSLTEVLIAMFIMAIGLISLLVLFPYGALQMAQAIKDDRCAYAADAAHVQAVLFWKNIFQTHDAAGVPIYRPYRQAQGEEPALYALEDPEDTATSYTGDAAKITTFSPAFTRPATLTNPEIFDTLLPTGPPPLNRRSYPVFIDPMGWEAHRRNNLSAGRDWVAGQGGAGGPYRRIPRRTLKALNQYYTPQIPPMPTPAIIRATTLLDDIGFSSDGRALDPATGSVQRGGKYTWSYMIRRDAFMPLHEVNLTVLVFADRNLDTATQEEAYGVTYTTGQTSMSVNTAGARPYIRKGGFIMDASRTGTGNSIIQNAKFYRVTQITETANSYELELNEPIQSSFSVTPGTGGLIYVFDTELNGRLMEVFERGPISIYRDPLP